MKHYNYIKVKLVYEGTDYQYFRLRQSGGWKRYSEKDRFFFIAFVTV